MTFWLYNFGFPMAVSERRLTPPRKPTPLEELAKTSRTKSTEADPRPPIVVPPLHYPKQPAEDLIEEIATAQTSASDSDKSVYHSSLPQEGEKAIIAQQIMSFPVMTLSETTEFEQAQNLFQQHRYRHFPVVDKQQRLLGIISDRDILNESVQMASRGKANPAKPLKLLMQGKVLTASKTTPIRDICLAMFDQHIGSMPVTDESGKILGIITRSDVLRAMIQHAPLELWI